MSIITYLFGLLAAALKTLLPTILDEYRKPREVRFVGDDAELNAAIDAQIQSDSNDYAKRMVVEKSSEGEPKE